MRRRTSRCARTPRRPAAGAASRVKPPSPTAASTSSYAPGEVTIATDGWFFAAARTIDGPPMSICSTHSSGGGARAHGLGERVEVGDDQVERLDAEVGELLHVGLEAAVGEDAGVHLRVQRLDPAVEALGEAGEVLDLGDREAERRRSAAAEPPVETSATPASCSAAGEVLEAGLVVDGDQGPADRAGGRRAARTWCDSSSVVDEGTQAFDALDFTPWWLPTCASRVRPAYCTATEHGPRRTLRPSIVKPSRAIRPTVVDQHRPLGDLDPLVQRLDVVVVLDRHRRLGHDRAGVDAGVDDEQRRAGDLDAVRQRVGGPVHAREGRRQRRVGVDGSGRRTRPGTPRRPAS